MERELFERRFLAASIKARDFARTFIEEPLPDAMRFNVHLNGSHDVGAGPEVKLFPEDSRDQVARRNKNVSAEQVVDLLWRDGLVPQWVDVTVVGETGDATLLDVDACGRFIGDETALYYKWTDVAPFGPKGPSLPVGYVEGQRFSIYDRSACWSLEHFARVMERSSKVWSLELHGPAFDDEVLSTALASSTVEILDVRGAPLRGSGLRGLARLPKLRILRMTSGEVDALSLAALPPSARLEVMEIENLPSSLHGVAQLIASTPNLKRLSLGGARGTTADAVVTTRRLEDLRLALPRVPTWVLPGPHLRTLGVHASESNDDEVIALLSRVFDGLEDLHLRGTPVTDSLFEALSRFTGLRYLDLDDTAVTHDGLARFAGTRPALGYHPRPRQGG
jgi:hypothetical protein